MRLWRCARETEGGKRVLLACVRECSGLAGLSASGRGGGEYNTHTRHSVRYFVGLCTLQVSILSKRNTTMHASDGLI
jgi:hypothetical protein